MHVEEPDPAAYGQATNPERFRAVVEAARDRIEQLLKEFDVAAEPGMLTDDFPNWKGTEALEIIRLHPATGVPITLMMTAFPGVAIRIGQWGREVLPHCGCDGCDDQPSDLIERLDEILTAVVAGGYEEELTKRRLRTSLTGSWGRSVSEGPLHRGEWRDLGARGTYRWPPWSRRTPSDR